LEDAPHLRDRGEYHWSEAIPRVYTLETLWADSGIAALQAMGRPDLVDQIRLAKLAAYCVVANKSVRWQVFRDLQRGLEITRKNRVIGTADFAWSLLTGPGLSAARRAWRRICILAGVDSRSANQGYRLHDLSDMVNVSRALTGYLRDNELAFMDNAREANLSA
jgi:hypothetical protein